MARNRVKYKPAAPFNVPMKLLTPITSVEYGAVKKTFTAPEDSELFFGSFRTYGGTENVENGVYTLIDTASVGTWYRPDIKGDCRVYLCDNEQIYEIISDPEDIDMRHQFLQFKVRKVGGKA